jgi:hypothetical protein
MFWDDRNACSHIVSEMKTLPYLALIVVIMTGSARADCWTDLQRTVAERNLQIDEASKRQVECQVQADKDFKVSRDISDYSTAMEKCGHTPYEMSQRFILDALDGRIACLKQTTGANNGH